MSKFKVLLTDYAWADLDIERETLAKIDAELVVAPAGDVATLAGLATDVDAIMTNWAKVPAEVIQAAPRCKIVSRLGIGLDNIDVAAATERNMLVTNVPDYCLIEVAEHALALMLALARKVAYYHHETKQWPLRTAIRSRVAAHRRTDAGHRRAGEHRHEAGGKGHGDRPEGARHVALRPRHAGGSAARGTGRIAGRRATTCRCTCRRCPRRGI